MATIKLMQRPGKGLLKARGTTTGMYITSNIKQDGKNWGQTTNQTNWFAGVPREYMKGYRLVYRAITIPTANVSAHYTNHMGSAGGMKANAADMVFTTPHFITRKESYTLSPNGSVSRTGSYTYGFKQGTSSIASSSGFDYGLSDGQNGYNTWDDSSNGLDDGALSAPQAPSRLDMSGDSRKLQRVVEIWTNDLFHGGYLSDVMCDSAEQDWKFGRYSTTNTSQNWHLKGSYIFNTSRRTGRKVTYEDGSTVNNTFDGTAEDGTGSVNPG